MNEIKYSSAKNLFLVYFSLVVLLILTVTASTYPLGAWSFPVSFGIAAAKSVLVALFFMNLRMEPRPLQLVAIAGLFWLALLMALTFGDYLTRFSFGVLGK
ncbi:MAG: cytochrome C oxidase subunit IV family protein [Pseudobdellovibrionaceae bacterium]